MYLQTTNHTPAEGRYQTAAEEHRQLSGGLTLLSCKSLLLMELWRTGQSSILGGDILLYWTDSGSAGRAGPGRSG